MTKTLRIFIVIVVLSIKANTQSFGITFKGKWSLILTYLVVSKKVSLHFLHRKISKYLNIKPNEFSAIICLFLLEVHFMTCF